MLSEQRRFEDIIMSEVSKEKLLNHIKWLGENAAPRLSGTPTCRKAAEYIKKVNEENGVDVNLFEFMAYMCEPEKAEVKITYPEEKEIEAYTYAFTPSTPPTGLEGEIVAAGIGTEEDIRKADVEGKVVLVRYSGFIPISYNEKIRVAERAGAVAFIHQNWTPPEMRLFHYGSAKHVWGVPTLDQLTDSSPEFFAHIPALCTTRKDGDYIRKLLEEGEVRIRIKSATCPKWAKILQPVATVTGGDEPDRFVMVGGHFDAYGGGATDNATGNALCIELARIFEKHRDKMKRSVRFGWWNGHETAKQSGSTWYLDNFWGEFSRDCLVYVNVDSPGTAPEKDVTGPTMFYGNGAPIIKQHSQGIMRELAEKTNKPYSFTRDESRGPSGTGYKIIKTGDQSFLGVGVPTAFIGARYTKEFLETVDTVSTSSLGWWYHSEGDTLDKIDLDALVDATKAVAVFVARLCNLPVLPFKTAPVAEWMLQGLKEHAENGKELFNLQELIEKTRKFRDVAALFDESVDELAEKCVDENFVKMFSRKIDAANACLIKLSRILDPINYTVAGRYSHDRWGDLLKPIPGLQKIQKLPHMDRESGEYAAVITELVREKNKVFDALEEAISLIESSQEKL